MLVATGRRAAIHRRGSGIGRRRLVCLKGNP
jgi:hypothetical protein